MINASAMNRTILFFALLISVCTSSILISCGGEADTDGTDAKASDRSDTTYIRDSAFYASMDSNTVPLSGGASSPDELIGEVLTGLQRLDTASLQRLMITQGEFDTIIYPEQGMHYAGSRDMRPEVKRFIWQNLEGSRDKGLRRILRDLGERKLTAVSIEFDDTKVFPSYVAHEGTKVTVTDEHGKKHELHSIGSLIEKDGIFKLMSYRDRDN